MLHLPPGDLECANLIGLSTGATTTVNINDALVYLQVIAFASELLLNYSTGEKKPSHKSHNAIFIMFIFNFPFCRLTFIFIVV